MSKYTEKLKLAMVTKLLHPNGPSALALAGKTGISQSTLCLWVREYKNKGRATLSNLERRPKDFSKEEKFKSILECEKLSSTELGTYLRKNGLTTAHLEKWKKEFVSGEEKRGVGRPSKSSEEKDLQKEIKYLKRDLHRKDKALAEAAALLILKKKAQAIWGMDEEEE